jgi:hypothetical protein
MMGQIVNVSSPTYELLSIARVGNPPPPPKKKNHKYVLGGHHHHKSVTQVWTDDMPTQTW